METKNVFIDANGEVVDPHMIGGTPFRVRPPWARTRMVTVNDLESMTQQSDVDQTDIDAIVARFERTGVLPAPNQDRAQYGDVCDLQVDLTTALNRAQEVINKARDFEANWKPPEPAPTPSSEPDNPPPAPASNPA